MLEVAGLEANVRRWEHNLDTGSASRISVRRLRLEVRCWRCGGRGVGSSLFLSFFSSFPLLCSRGLQRFCYFWQTFGGGKQARFSILVLVSKGRILAQRLFCLRQNKLNFRCFSTWRNAFLYLIMISLFPWYGIYLFSSLSIAI